MVDSHDNWNHLIISQFFINGRFAWKWKHSEIIQPRRGCFLLLWLNNSPISIGRDSLDYSEEERLFSSQLTDNQWADFYPNSPLTDWRIHLGHCLGHYLGRTLYLTCFLTSGSLPVSLPVLSLSIKKGYHILWHPILLQELRPLLSPSLSPYSG